MNVRKSGIIRPLMVLIGLSICCHAEARNDAHGYEPYTWLDFEQTANNSGSNSTALDMVETEAFVATDGGYGWRMSTLGYQSSIGASTAAYTIVCRFSPNDQIFNGKKVICAVNGQAYGGPVITVEGDSGNGYVVTLGKHLNKNFSVAIGTFTIPANSGNGNMFITCYFVVNNNNSADVYVNGNKVGSFRSQLSSGRNAFVAFGRYGNSGTDNAVATGAVIDDFRYYDFAMSKLQVQTDAGILPTEGELVGDSTDFGSNIQWTNPTKTIPAGGNELLTATLAVNTTATLRLTQNTIFDELILTGTGDLTIELAEGATFFDNGINVGGFTGTLTVNGQGTWERDFQNATWTGNTGTGATTLPRNVPAFGATWYGTFFAKNLIWQNFNFEQLGANNSTVKLLGVSGYAPKGAIACGLNVCLEDDGDLAGLTVNNGYSGAGYYYQFLKLSGGGTFAASLNASATPQFWIEDGSMFTGKITNNATGSNQAARIAFGSGNTQTDAGKITVLSNVVLNDDNNIEFWSSKSGFRIQGTIETAQANFATNPIVIDSTGTLRFDFAANVDWRNVELNGITGTGTLELGGSGWIAMPGNSAQLPASSLRFVNNAAIGVVLASAEDNVLGTLSGDGFFRADIGDTVSPHNLEIRQDGVSTFDGRFVRMQQDGRARDLTVSVSSSGTTADYANKRLILRAPAPASSSIGAFSDCTTPLQVLANGAVEMDARTWNGDGEISGAIGGTGTFSGDLHFNDGAILIGGSLTAASATFDDTLYITSALNDGDTVLTYTGNAPTINNTRVYDENDPTLCYSLVVDSANRQVKLSLFNDTITYLDEDSNELDDLMPTIYDTTQDTLLPVITDTRPGYTWAGFYTDLVNNKRIDKIEAGLHGPQTVYSVWTANVYQVRFEYPNVDAGTWENIVNNNATEYTFSDEASDVVVLTSASLQDYIFDGWYEDPEMLIAITQYTRNTMDNNKTIFGKFTPDTPPEPPEEPDESSTQQDINAGSGVIQLPAGTQIGEVSISADGASMTIGTQTWNTVNEHYEFLIDADSGTVVQQIRASEAEVGVFAGNTGDGIAIGTGVETVEGFYYSVEHADNLQFGNSAKTTPVAGNGTVMTFDAPRPANASAHYYRLNVSDKAQ